MTDEPPKNPRRRRSGTARITGGKSDATIARRVQRVRVLLAMSSLVVLLLAAAGGWLAYRAAEVRSNLESSRSLLPQLQAALAERDTERATTVAAELQDRTAAARSAGTDPLWKTAGLVPFIGQNFSAVSEVTVTADDVVNRAVAPMVNQFAALDWNSLTPVGGRIDTAPLSGIAPTLSAAANTVELSYGRLEGIDRAGLLPQIAGPLKEAIESLDEARAPISGAARASQLLPTMLGAEGPRTYLVLVQNSAEVRATGGIPGALAVLTVDDGRISLTDQGSASELGRFKPPIEVDAEQEQIYSARLSAYMQNVNLTPDFPTAAATARQMWQDRHPDAHIDGVIALDPVVLANLLYATGPVELGQFGDPVVAAVLAGTQLPTALDSTNVVPTLLSDVYAQIEDPAVQDEYFAAVAGKVFEALADSQGDSQQLMDAIVTSADDGRLYVWSALSAEQELLAQTDLAGAATGARVGGAAFGAYFNDGTGAKMDYYIRRTAQLLRQCTDDGYSQYTLKVTLKNTAPADAATTLPEYVTGGGVFGVAPGSVQTNTIAYGPAQSFLETARLNGKDVPLGSFAHGNRPVGVLTTQLAPGESATLEVDFAKVVQEGEPVLDVTPTLQNSADVIQSLESSGPCDGAGIAR